MEFAKADSLLFKSHYVQQRRKKRKSGVPAPVQRYFTELVAAGGMYYDFSSPVALSTSYEVEITVSSTSLSSTVFICDGQDSNNRLWCIVSPSGAVTANTATVSQVFVDGVLNGSLLADGKLRKIVLKGSAPSAVIGYIASRFNAASTFSGFMADLKVWNGGDRNTGALVVDCPINEAPGVNTIGNLANPSNPLIRVNQPEAATLQYTLGDDRWVGDELLQNGSFDSDTVWQNNGTTITGGELVFGSGTTFADQASVMFVGRRYLVEYEMSDFSGGIVGASSVSFNDSLYADSVGLFSGERISANSSLRLVSTQAGNSISRASLKNVLRIN